MAPDRFLDPDRAGIAAFLAARGLVLLPSTSRTRRLGSPGGPLAFDGSPSDLYLDPLDQEDPVTGGLFHATLSPAECAFVYDLCLAGGMLVLNPQSAPTLVVPTGTHVPADLPPSIDDVAWVSSGAELAEALGGGFERFLDYREQVLGEG